MVEGIGLDHKKYLSKIGSKGGRKSKRILTPEQAKKMAEKRWEKKDAE